jgi:hypothetical protein
MAVFEASPEGFRQQQIGRPAAHLVRELIQNVMDEPATKLDVTVRYSPVKGVVVVVEDNIPGGFRDEKLVFTIFESDKQDVPTKRGRMGRGLKEMVSVADRTSVQTQGRGEIVFKREREAPHDWSRSQTREPTDRAVGSRVECHVHAWRQREATAIIKFLRQIRPVASLTITVNGEVLAHRTATEKHQMRLSAPVFIVDEGERKERERLFDTSVELFQEEKSYVYEMGIPVEPIDYPLSIDVGQRIPLREKRDAVTGEWKAELFASLLNQRAGLLSDEEFRDSHVLLGASRMYYLNQSVRERILKIWTDGKPYASTPKAFAQATGQHIEVVSLRKLPEAIREIVQRWGTKVETVFEQRRAEFCPMLTPEALTPDQARLIAIWQWICEGIKRTTKIEVCNGKPGAQASFDRSTYRLSIYQEEVSVNLFRKPLSGESLSLLIHELSHWEAREDEHGMDFHSDAEHVGGDVANFLLRNAADALQRARGE